MAKLTDIKCSQCGAPPGTPCVFKGPHRKEAHAPRADYVWRRNRGLKRVTK